MQSEAESNIINNMIQHTNQLKVEIFLQNFAFIKVFSQASNHISHFFSY